MDDDEELDAIGKAYSSGEMLTGEIKKRLADVLAEIVKEHQAARAEVTDEVVHRFMDPERPELRGRWSEQ